MRGFCVECGKEGVVYEGLCEDCLPKKRRFVKAPPKLTLRQCQHCGAYDLPGGWRRESLDNAVDKLVEEAVEIPRDVQRHQLDLRINPEDDRNLRVEMSAQVALDGITVVEESALRLLVKATTCPDCSKRRGEYYEGIIQVRGVDRPVTKDEFQAASQVIEERVVTSDGVFIAKKEEVHGGLDVYISSNEAARSIAKALKARLGGTVSSSPKLHTRKGGKDLYRVTHLLRLPGVSAGEIVEIDGRLHQILATGEPAKVIDLERGEHGTVRSRELLEAKRVKAEVMRATIVSQTADEVQVMDSEGYRVRTVVRPRGLEIEGTDVTLIITGSGEYIAPPKKEG